jgi:hypothetical protein
MVFMALLLSGGTTPIHGAGRTAGPSAWTILRFDSGWVHHYHREFRNQVYSSSKLLTLGDEFHGFDENLVSSKTALSVRKAVPKRPCPAQFWMALMRVCQVRSGGLVSP